MRIIKTTLILTLGLLINHTLSFSQSDSSNLESRPLKIYTSYTLLNYEPYLGNATIFELQNKGEVLPNELDNYGRTYNFYPTSVTHRTAIGLELMVGKNKMSKIKMGLSYVNMQRANYASYTDDLETTFDTLVSLNTGELTYKELDFSSDFDITRQAKGAGLSFVYLKCANPNTFKEGSFKINTYVGLGLDWYAFSKSRYIVSQKEVITTNYSESPLPLTQNLNNSDFFEYNENVLQTEIIEDSGVKFSQRIYVPFVLELSFSQKISMSLDVELSLSRQELSGLQLFGSTGLGFSYRIR